MFKQKVWPIAIGLIGLVTLSSAACAKEEVVSQHQFTVSQTTEISIDNPVGEIEFIRGETDQMVIELTIKETDDGFFYGGGDVYAVDLVSDWSGEQLRLSIEPDEDVQAHWRITMPKVAEISVDMGVGEISGEIYTTHSSFDLGVGEINLDVYGEDIARISIDAGIGDSKITGFSQGKNETTRAMVSSESDAHGNGQYRLTADVGVGEARLNVRGLK